MIFKLNITFYDNDIRININVYIINIRYLCILDTWHPISYGDKKLHVHGKVYTCPRVSYAQSRV